MVRNSAVHKMAIGRPAADAEPTESSPPRPDGLKAAAELAAARSHGDRLKYIGGCRCDACRAANTRYERERGEARRAGDWNGLVPAKQARRHLLHLSKLGVGRHSVHDASGVSGTVLVGIVSGAKRSIRARTEKRILAVTAGAAADGALTSAAPTWRRLNALLKDGYTRAELARRLGCTQPSLQLGRRQVTVRTAYRVERLFEQLRMCGAARSIARLEQLRSEGYRMHFIEEQLRAEAQLRGLPEPDLKVRNGRIHALTAQLLEQLHERLLA